MQVVPTDVLRYYQLRHISTPPAIKTTRFFIDALTSKWGIAPSFSKLEGQLRRCPRRSYTYDANSTA